MATIRLNNNDVVTQFPNAKNLGDVIGLVEHTLNLKDEVLVSISVNGSKLSASDELDQTNMEIKRMNDLAFESSPVFQLLNDTLVLLQNQFSQMANLSKVTSDLFRTMNQKQAAENFADLVAACEQTIEALVQIQILLSHRKVDGVMPEEWASVAMLFQQVITDMVRAYEKQDLETVADFLAEKFPASLLHWSNFVTRIGELVEFGLAKSNRQEPSLPST